MSKIVTFSIDDEQASVSMYLFKSLQFEFSGMGGKPTSYHYIKAKDSIKWIGLKPKHFISLLDAMFNSFISNLPSK